MVGKNTDRELEVATVAAMLGISHNTVRRLMAKQELRWTSRGAKCGFRVFESSVRDFKERRDRICSES